jgi:NAD(P)-dependent dehydrogenase (short-subunit alcohol dehydrogenase family)
MRVTVCDIEAKAADQVADEIRSSGGSAIAKATDVSDLDSVLALADAAAEAFGPVHLLCNNAGVMIRRRGTHAGHDDWRWVMGVNLWGVIHGMEAFLPGMLAHGEDAHVVNTASMNGIFPSASSALYSTTKYAILGLSETFANELAGTNVGISVLCPASVSTRIRESERNRPASLEPPPPTPGFDQPSSVFDISPPLDPLAVGELVLNGVRLRQLHIFTDAKVQPIIQRRHDRMMAEFDHLRAWETTRHSSP